MAKVRKLLVTCAKACMMHAWSVDSTCSPATLTTYTVLLTSAAWTVLYISAPPPLYEGVCHSLSRQQPPIPATLHRQWVIGRRVLHFETIHLSLKIFVDYRAKFVLLNEDCDETPAASVGKTSFANYYLFAYYMCVVNFFR